MARATGLVAQARATAVPPRAADRRGDLGVGPRLAVRNRAERLPHLPLKRGRLYVERQIQPRLPAGEMRENRVRPLRQRAGVAAIVARDTRATSAASARRPSRSHRHRADAARGRRHQQPAERRFGESTIV